MKEFLIGAGVGTLIGVAIKTIIDSNAETKELSKKGNEHSSKLSELLKVVEVDIGRCSPDFRRFAVDSYCKKNNMTLEDSIELARSVGVPEEDILKTMEDVDKFFLE